MTTGTQASAEPAWHPPLTHLEPDARQKVWDGVLAETSGRQPSARNVREFIAKNNRSSVSAATPAGECSLAPSMATRDEDPRGEQGGSRPGLTVLPALEGADFLLADGRRVPYAEWSSGIILEAWVRRQLEEIKTSGPRAGIRAEQARVANQQRLLISFSTAINRLPLGVVTEERAAMLPGQVHDTCRGIGQFLGFAVESTGKRIAHSITSNLMFPPASSSGDRADQEAA